MPHRAAQKGSTVYIADGLCSLEGALAQDKLVHGLLVDGSESSVTEWLLRIQTRLP